LFVIPKNIDFELKTNLKKVTYGNMVFENVTESVTLQSVVGDEAIILFTSFGTWNVTTDAVWLSLSPLSGEAGEGQVKVTAIFENNTNKLREAKVKLSSGDEVCEISVFQEIGDYVLPEKDEYLVDVDGGMFTIRFETNVEAEKLKVYTSSEPGSWLRQESSSRSATTETQEVTLNAAPNRGGMSRSAYLLFIKEEDGVQKELATVKISQLGGQVLESVDYSEDGKIDTLQQHTKGDGIPIVLMGDGFVDQELAHALYGMKLAEKFKEKPDICNAIGAHHDEVEMTSLLAPIVQVCDAISGARPGARREIVEAYIKRLNDLEQLAMSYPGVTKTYAIQAGRELRVIVGADKIDDKQTENLSGEIAKKIQDEMTYPGQVKITVIRETRAVSYAK
jgi:hypothetical protein